LLIDPRPFMEFEDEEERFMRGVFVPF